MLALSVQEHDAFAELFGQGRGRREPNENATPVTSYASLQAFYDADRRRKRSPEVDYGVHWRGPEHRDWPRWKVSYVGLTGEVYAHEQAGAGRVVVLGAVAADCDPLMTDAERAKTGQLYYRTVDRLLDGWTERHQDPDGLRWVARRLTYEKR